MILKATKHKVVDASMMKAITQNMVIVKEEKKLKYTIYGRI